ncbi:MAG: leucine-rich repeat domain-containing protein [Butyrivibrio sp.]|nr:leucine-rich repeat domain-containing protein [Butyrivibrio sp.]
MKRPMKLLSMFTAASLAFSSFAAMAVPMTAYAAAATVSIVEDGDGGDSALSLLTGYEAQSINIKVSQTYGEDAVTWDANDIQGVMLDESDYTGDEFSWTEPAQAPEQADAETTLEGVGKLDIATGLAAGVYVVSIGTSTKTADYTVTVADPPTITGVAIAEKTVDGADDAVTLENGYSDTPVVITVTETLTSAENAWEVTTIQSKKKDGNAFTDSSNLIAWAETEDAASADGTTKAKDGKLTIKAGLEAGSYTIAIGTGEGDLQDTYTVTIEEPEPVAPDYELSVTPTKVALNKTTKSAKVKANIKNNTESALGTVKYRWVLSADEQTEKAFSIPESTTELDVKNAEVEVSVTADADKIFEAAKEKNAKLESLTAELYVIAEIGEETVYLGEDDGAFVTYTPVEEKKDEPKKEDDKAPAAKGTELKDTTGTFKVTDAGEVEYEAPATTTAKSVTIPDEIKDEKGNVYKVTSVAPNAFKNNKKITKAVIGKNVTTIGANAFSGCKKLKNLELDGNVVKTIGKNAFKGTKKGLKVKIFAKNKKTAQKLFNKVVKKGKAKGAVLKFKKRAVKK